MEMPSGILCSAIDIARIKPNLRSMLEEINEEKYSKIYNLK